MNDQITPSSSAHSSDSLLRWCFETSPEALDWAAVIARPEQLDLSALLTEMEALGPVPYRESLVDSLDVWRLQQKIRLAVRHKSGLPLATSMVCSHCGTRPMDPVLYGGTCLHCADIDQQWSSLGSRSNCSFLRPAYDPTRQSWGLLSYRSHLADNQRSPFLHFLAAGYKDRESALDALLPLSNYANFAASQADICFRVPDAVDYMQVVSRDLPMTPHQWREYCRERILELYAQHDPHSIERILSTAIRDIA